MRERGILFSGAMVRAILAGRKTQTRRAMRNQPRWCSTKSGGHWWYGHPNNKPTDLFVDWGVVLDAEHLTVIGTEGRGWGAHAGCPHGVPGDRLWVRETWGFDCRRGEDTPVYRADHAGCSDSNRCFCRLQAWRPSILMPRSRSRITLEVTGIRVERAHDISDADVEAEGVDAEAVEALWESATRKRRGEVWHPNGAPVFDAMRPRELWRAAWTLINGRESWDANPWVWVVSFRRTP